jgi:hypothetical protein
MSFSNPEKQEMDVLNNKLFEMLELNWTLYAKGG